MVAGRYMLSRDVAVKEMIWPPYLTDQEVNG